MAVTDYRTGSRIPSADRDMISAMIDQFRDNMEPIGQRSMGNIHTLFEYGGEISGDSMNVDLYKTLNSTDDNQVAQITSRYQDVTASQSVHFKRQIFPYEFGWAHYFSRTDIKKMLGSPDSKLLKLLYIDLRREQMEEAIAALTRNVIEKYKGTNKQTTTQEVKLPASQYLKDTKTQGFTYKRLLGINKQWMDIGYWSPGMLSYLLVPPIIYQNAKDNEEIKNSLYSGVHPVTNGEVPMLDGHILVPCNGLTISSGVYNCIAFLPQAMYWYGAEGAMEPESVYLSVEELQTKYNTMQIKAEAEFAGSREDDNGIIILQCKTSEKAVA